MVILIPHSHVTSWYLKLGHVHDLAHTSCFSILSFIFWMTDGIIKYLKYIRLHCVQKSPRWLQTAMKMSSLVPVIHSFVVIDYKDINKISLHLTAPFSLQSMRTLMSAAKRTVCMCMMGCQILCQLQTATKAMSWGCSAVWTPSIRLLWKPSLVRSKCLKTLLNPSNYSLKFGLLMLYIRREMSLEAITTIIFVIIIVS